MDSDTKIRQLHGRVGGLQRALLKAERRLGRYADSLGKLRGVLATAQVNAEARKALLEVLNEAEVDN